MATTSIASLLLLGRGRTQAAIIMASRRRIAAAGAAPASRMLSTAVPFQYQELFQLGKDTETPYRKLTSDHVFTFTVRFALVEAFEWYAYAQPTYRMGMG